jgi:hypothetical protein
MPPATDEEITRRVNARIPNHPWSGLGWRLLFPSAAIVVVLPALILVLPERFLLSAFITAMLAAFYANHLREKRVIERNYEKGLLWEELYRKSSKPHRFENCRIYHAEDHPADYLYFLAMDDGRFIECISEDVYYGFRDGFPDELLITDAAEGFSVTLQIKQSGTRDLADPIMIHVPRTYKPATLKVYRAISHVPDEIREAINRIEQVGTSNGG